MANQASYIYSDVATRNNRAVEDMLNGDLASANAGFRDCFVLVKQCLADGADCHNSHEESSTASSVRRPLHYRASSTSASSFSVLRLVASPRGVRQQTLQNEEDDFYVFDRPILVCYNNGIDHDIVGMGQVFSAALIFNMALLFHIKAQRGAGLVHSAKHMAKAQQLYLTVVKIATSRENGEEENQIKPMMKNPKAQRQAQRQREYASKWKLELGLAAINNYSTQLYYHGLGELEMAERAAAVLQSSISELSPELYVFSTSEWDQILSNFLFLTMTKTRPAGGGLSIPCAPAA